MKQMSLIDFLPKEQQEKYRPKKSTDWKWSFKDYPKEKNGLKVFSCFSCGGGSTMGYKLAGCEVIGCCEIDPRMNKVYIKNHNPQHNFCMDIRRFNETPNEELPDELFKLDILDGSPPCTPFSMAGDREESWGKNKKFKEGQAEQILDDLSFVFIETVAKLKPKVAIMENVEGLLKGEAWKYVQEIYRMFKEAGYDVKHYLCKGETMGVPQSRHRTIFIAVKKARCFDFDHLDMSFNYEPVIYADIKSGKGQSVQKDSQYYKCLLIANENDKSIGDVLERMGKKKTCFSDKIVWEQNILPTIVANTNVFRGAEKTRITDKDILYACTFPEDYDFCGTNVGYICGMSVPPIMIKRIVTRLIESGVFDAENI